LGKTKIWQHLLLRALTEVLDVHVLELFRLGALVADALLAEAAPLVHLAVRRESLVRVGAHLVLETGLPDDIFTYFGTFWKQGCQITYLPILVYFGRPWDGKF
jgi:hypothetical protein